MRSHDVELWIGIVGVLKFNIKGCSGTVMISILPLQKTMSSDDKVAQLEAQLQRARAERAARKAAEERQIAAEMVVVEAKWVAEEKAAAEVRQVEEEQRVAELKERRKALTAAKARAKEATAHWITEEKVALEPCQQSRRGGQRVSSWHVTTA